MLHLHSFYQKIFKRLMSSVSNITNDINISHPEMWKLALRLDCGGLKFILHSTVEDNSLIYRDIRFPDSGDSYLKRLENTIYDNPIFLQEYKNVSIVIESQSFIIIPEEYTGDDEATAKLFDFSFPNFEGELIKNALQRCKATIVFGIEKGIESFLQRTFDSSTLLHHLSPLCEYFHKKSSLGNVSKLYAYLHEGNLSVCIFNRNGLALANSFKCRHINDVAYYILNCWQTHKLNVLTDELQVLGNKDMREELMPMLRKYVNFVMPMIFPSAIFKTGQDALKVPFDLIVLPLCE